MKIESACVDYLRMPAKVSLLFPVLRDLATGQISCPVETANCLTTATARRNQLGSEGVVEFTPLHASEVVRLVYFRYHGE